MLGILGVAIVVLSLVIGDLFEGVLGDFDGGGILSTPVIGAFLGAFGFAGAIILANSNASTAVAALGGAGAGLAFGGIAMAITRSIMNMPTDDPVRAVDWVGSKGTVITRIPQDGLGEVSLNHRGNILKLSARSAEPVPAGTPVTVTAVTSSSSVVVTPNAI